MKLIITAFLFAFTFLSIEARAQQTHYIYIQTNNHQSFYVKWNNTVYSSAVSGYLILSKLVDSTYNFSIGFPKNQGQLQNFSCTINGNDKGYLLKNLGDKGWGLLNLQTLDVTLANNVSGSKNIVEEERTDSFSTMLSAVVNDPAIKRTIKKIPEEVKPDTIQQVIEEPVVIAAKEPEAVVADVPADKPTEKSTIAKLLDETDKDGIQLIYADVYATHQDTIRIFIPADKVVHTVVKNKDTANSIAAAEPAKAQPKVENKKFIDMELPVSNTSVDAATKPVIVNVAKPAVIITTNNNCKNFATEEDFLKVRKKMVLAENDDDMVTVATKVFKAKCFTTAQIKNLGFLFLSDKGRYKFFDMAYSFVSDSENYNLLQNQLSDPYYINRFKAMISH